MAIRSLIEPPLGLDRAPMPPEAALRVIRLILRQRQAGLMMQAEAEARIARMVALGLGEAQ